MLTATRPYVTDYDDAKTYAFSGGIARVLAEAGKTDGGFSLLHMTLPQGNATPLHIHHTHDEAFFILHGEMKGVCGDEEWTASSGGFVWLPRGVPHAFQAVSEMATEVLVMTTPGGFDAFVADAGEPVSDAFAASVPGLNPALLAEIAARHDIAIVGPPVTYLG